MSDFDTCDNCGRAFHVDELDHKPSWFTGWIWRRMHWLLAFWLLDRAADLGIPFNRAECKSCYGPGFEAD